MSRRAKTKTKPVTGTCEALVGIPDPAFYGPWDRPCGATAAVERHDGTFCESHNPERLEAHQHETIRNFRKTHNLKVHHKTCWRDHLECAVRQVLLLQAKLRKEPT